MGWWYRSATQRLATPALHCTVYGVPWKAFMTKVWKPLNSSFPRGCMVHLYVQGSEKSCNKENCLSVILKIKQDPLLRNPKSFKHPSQKRECESHCLISSPEPYFGVNFLLRFAKHFSSTEHSLTNADPECLRPLTWDQQITSVLALCSSAYFSFTHPDSPQWISSILNLSLISALFPYWFVGLCVASMEIPLEQKPCYLFLISHLPHSQHCPLCLVQHCRDSEGFLSWNVKHPLNISLKKVPQ